jgi:hypothetical protein
MIDSMRSGRRNASAEIRVVELTPPRRWSYNLLLLLRSVNAILSTTPILYQPGQIHMLHLYEPSSGKQGKDRKPASDIARLGIFRKSLDTYQKSKCIDPKPQTSREY